MKTGFRLLFLIAFLFSLSAAAFSDCLNNDPFGLNIIENKIVIQEEVAVKVNCENMTDFISVESIQCDSVLLSNNILTGYGSQNRLYNFVKEIGLDTIIRIRLPPAQLTA